MVESKTVTHIIGILGAVACAHHFWPKGVTYGEQEEWEKAHRKRQEKSKSKSKRNGNGSGSGSSRSSDSHRQSTRYDDQYEERPRYSRHASSRY